MRTYIVIFPENLPVFGRFRRRNLHVAIPPERAYDAGDGQQQDDAGRGVQHMVTPFAPEHLLREDDLFAAEHPDEIGDGVVQRMDQYTGDQRLGLVVDESDHRAYEKGVQGLLRDAVHDAEYGRRDQDAAPGAVFAGQRLLEDAPEQDLLEDRRDDDGRKHHPSAQFHLVAEPFEPPAWEELQQRFDDQRRGEDGNHSP